MKTIHIGKLILLLYLILICITCSPEKTDKNLNKKPIEFLVKKMGKPKYDKEFILTKKLYEYQYQLLNFFPEPEKKNIIIREVKWEKRKRNIIVWFQNVNGEWISFDNLIWNPKIIKY